MGNAGDTAFVKFVGALQHANVGAGLQFPETSEIKRVRAFFFFLSFHPPADGGEKKIKLRLTALARFLVHVRVCLFLLGCARNPALPRS